MFDGVFRMDKLILFTLVPFIAAAYVSENPDTYCGHPGVPEYGEIRTPMTSSPSRRLNMQSTFPPRSEVFYECQGSNRVLRGEQVRRCGLDGRWTGTRPWCDTNVAYGKMVTYSASDGSTDQTNDMTDGLASVEDSQCPAVTKLASTVAYLEVDLGDVHLVNYVTVYFKDSVISIDGEKVQLVGVKECGRLRGRSATFNVTYECLRPSEDVIPLNYRNQRQNQGGNIVRFEHPYTYPVGICELEVFANPSRLECGQPEVPANGYLTVRQVNNYMEANYTCNEGYRLEGEGTRMCQGRSWRGRQPICVRLPYDITTESTTGETMSTTPDPNSNKGGSNVVQILLIVLVVLLAIGLMAAVIFLIKTGRCKCCKSRSPPTFTTLRQKKTISGSADYLEVKKADDQDERVAKRKTIAIEEEPEEIQTNYAQLRFTDRPKSEEFNSPTTEIPQIDGRQNETVYSQVQKRQSAAPRTETVPDAEVTLDSIDSPDGSPYQAKKRKSYIPMIYQVETATNQSLGMVNAQLRDALKGKKLETTDDL